MEWGQVGGGAEDVFTLTLSVKGQIQCELRNPLGTESCDCHLDILCKYGVGGGMQVQGGGDEDVFTLTLSDKGQIQCELRNPLGIESCDCHLDILCKYGVGGGMQMGVGMRMCLLWP